MAAMFDRDAGVLLHPTSLPGPYGIGDLGKGARQWVEFLGDTGTGYWQVLPLGPTGYGDSPYQCFSAFAGNPYLLSPELLAEDGLVDRADLEESPGFPAGHTDYGAVIPWKVGLLRKAHQRFRATRPAPLVEGLDRFRSRQASWLGDFALFMALKEEHGGGSWHEWPRELVERRPEALAAARSRLEEDIERHELLQYLFSEQWGSLRALGRERGLEIIGDAPIFVAADSSDVWANPDLFLLDEERRPTVVAGVPPDYFSATGQLWGNPLYDWERHAATGYAWWIDRLRTLLDLVDVLRIDHFRGFVDYWEIPAGAPTAETGRWVDGPGRDLFDAVRAALGDLPIIAEDLGEVHAAVPELRDELGLPGMKILQFAFDGDPRNEFLPHRYPRNCVAYTGTHDNDTTQGWFLSAPLAERRRVMRYLRSDGTDIVGDMLETLWSSRADLVVAPLQDFLRLGTEARMNTPGTSAGNWAWRAPAPQVGPALAAQITDLDRRHGRTSQAGTGQNHAQDGGAQSR